MIKYCFHTEAKGHNLWYMWNMNIIFLSFGSQCPCFFVTGTKVLIKRIPSLDNELVLKASVNKY